MIDEKDQAEEDRLTAEILERVQKLAELRLRDEKVFNPGKTAVKYAGRVYDGEEMQALTRATLEFWLTAGRWHRKLEKELAAWYQLPYARLVNSGSSANLLATSALCSPLAGSKRLRPGDEVITVAAGFPTTVAPLVQNGLVPVFVDVQLDTGNIDVAQLEAARSPKTRAIALAHTLGNPFDLDAVQRFCTQHSLVLLEDNCDAAGSLYRGRKTGTFGDLATLSFYPPHHMTTGEGGAVLARDEQLNRALESIRDWGRDCWCQPGVDNTCGKRFLWQLGELPEGYDHKYTYSHLGYNLKMTDLQASIGVVQLKKLDGFGSARRANWKFFRDTLADLSNELSLPEATEGSDPSWFGFLINVREGAPFTRDQLVAHLESKRIQTRMLFGGNLVRQPAFVQLARDRAEQGLPQPFRIAGDLKNTEAIMHRSFWIGVYPGLTEAMRDYVSEEIRAFVRRPQ